MKVFRFKFLVTALFLLVALFAAGFTAKTSPRAFAQPEVAAVEQRAETESLGSGYVLQFETDGFLPT